VLNPAVCWCVDLESAEELYQKRITRILTTDFPHYFAIVTRVRQESNTVGPDGGMIASTVIPQVQAVFPEGALTKHIKVGLQVTFLQLLYLTCTQAVNQGVVSEFFDGGITARRWTGRWFRGKTK